MTTDSERDVLEFAADQQLILAEQIPLITEIDAPDAERLLAQFAANGLLRHHREHPGHPGLFQITSRGLASIDSPLPEPRIETIRSDEVEISTAWVTIMARRGAFGETRQLLTRRVMLHRDRTQPHAIKTPDGSAILDPPYGVALPTSSPDPLARHYPHLMLVSGGWRVAFEIQLHQPPPRALARQITAYNADPDYGRVIYLTTSRQLGDPITEAAQRLGAHDKVRVQIIRITDRPTTAR